MSWKTKMAEIGGGNVTFLTCDGETLLCLAVGEPVLLHSKYKGTPQERVGCPVITDEGFMLFITGKRVARKMSKFEDEFNKVCLLITRHGEEGDINATYSVTKIDDAEKVKQLQTIKKKEYSNQAMKEAVDEATEILKG